MVGMGGTDLRQCRSVVKIQTRVGPSNRGRERVVSKRRGESHGSGNEPKGSDARESQGRKSGRNFPRGKFSFAADSARISRNFMGELSKNSRIQ